MTGRQLPDHGGGDGAAPGAGLRVDGVTRRFGDLVAVDGVGVEVGAGETLALLGPSGCGKSTLLRVIAGLEPADRGRVLLADRDVTTTPPHRRGVGLMFQDHALFAHRDVGDNVAFGLRMQGVGGQERRRRVTEALELVGLAGFAHRRVDTLSGGQAQRVALARALAPRPRVLLLDEPLGSLDRPLRDRLVGELADLFARLALTVVFVTHDHDEAFAVADRLAVMVDGRLARIGPPEEVWRSPGDETVARFLGHRNLVEVGPAGDLPWGGRLDPVEWAGRLVVVPEDAVEVTSADDPRAEVRARVLGVRFAGGRRRVRLRSPGPAGWELTAVTTTAPPVGATVGVRVDGARLVAVARRGDAQASSTR